MEYSLCNVGLRLSCRSQNQERSVGRIWERLFALEGPSQAIGGRRIAFHFGLQSENDTTGECLFDAPGLKVIRTHDGYLLRSGESYLTVALSQSKVTGWLSDGFFNGPLEHQRGMFFFAFLLALAGHGLYGLHSSGLAFKGHGYLLVGDSGCGKTTLAVALARSGWNYLSDDAVLLRQGPAGLQAHAFGRPFSCGPTIISHFSELGTLLHDTLPLGNGKRLLDVQRIYPRQFIDCCRPDVILFPEISSNCVSRLIPLDATATLTRLIGQGIGLLAERDSVIGQLRVLRELVRHGRSFRLLHGQDVHSNPARVSEMLIEAASLFPQMSYAEGELIGARTRS